MKVSDFRNGAVLGQVSDMDLRLLRVFKAVVECGGMQAAELELNIGVSTISRHVKDLEIRLAVVLCRRGRSGFLLTDEGRGIYEETLRLLAAVDAFRGSVDAIQGRLGGALHVAIFDKTATNPQSRIAQAVRHFRQSAGEVALYMHVATIGEIERGVMNGSFQVGIIPSHRSSFAFSYGHLFQETMLLYCASAHPLFGKPSSRLTWAGLREHAFAGLGYQSPNMQLGHHRRLVRQATGFDQESIATLVLSGEFLGFLPDHYAQAFVDKGLMQAVAPERFRYDCSFVSLLRRKPEPGRAAQLFVDSLARAHRPEAPRREEAH